MAEVKIENKPSAKDIADRISFRIHTASRLIQQMSRYTLKLLDLTPAQWRALMGVCTESGMTLQKLADFAQISQPLMSQAVKVLQDRNLVSRSTAVGDRRVSIIVATPEGIRVGEQAYSAMMQLEEHLVSSMGGNDTNTLKTLLDKLIAGCPRT